jgi:hypothetical protein
VVNIIKNYAVLFRVFPVITIIMALSISILSSFSSAVENDDKTKCNCVVFRLDDVEDYGNSLGQIATMELFLSKNQTLSLALIMDSIGNDSSVLDLVQEGVSKGLFELGIHGWNHTDYTKLTQKEQRDTLDLANKKMKVLFGNESEIFIPPLDEFNEDTVKSMSQLGFRVLSSGTWAEESFDQGKSIFNATNKANQNGTLHQQIFHLPSTISFKVFENGKWIKNSIKDIVNNATDGIDKYGYAVIVLHPQDFLKIENGEFVDVLVADEISDLSLLLDSILSRNIDIVSFSKIVGIEPNK